LQSFLFLRDLTSQSLHKAQRFARGRNSNAVTGISTVVLFIISEFRLAAAPAAAAAAPSLMSMLSMLCWAVMATTQTQRIEIYFL
jgi:hypothetical protein